MSRFYRPIGASILLHISSLAIVVVVLALMIALLWSGVDAQLFTVLLPATLVLAGPGLLASTLLLVWVRHLRWLARIAVCVVAATALTAALSWLSLGSIDRGPGATSWDYGSTVLWTAMIAGLTSIVAAGRGIRPE